MAGLFPGISTGTGHMLCWTKQGSYFTRLVVRLYAFGYHVREKEGRFLIRILSFQEADWRF
jgi:hypothetical protein